MIINFKDIEVSNLKNFKGGDGEVIANMFYDGTNRIFIARLKKGSSIGFHLHDVSSEIMYILEGVATVKYNEDEIKYAYPGEVHYCKKGNMHSVSNTHDDDLVMLCVVPEQ